MKSYNTLQVERITRYLALRERKANKPLTAEQRNNLTQYWIDKYAAHFRKWHTTAIKLRIRHSGGSLVSVGSGEFKRAVRQLREAKTSITDITKEET